ncbi:MAG: hypothetical protein ABI601_12820 [bacterium]
MPSSNELVAHALLTSLLEETRTSTASKLAENPEAFGDALSVRGRTLDLLEQSVHALSTSDLRDRSGGHRASACDSLLELASELARANTTVLNDLCVERDRIGAALAAAGRPDGMAAMYGDSAAFAGPHLDLLR